MRLLNLFLYFAFIAAAQFTDGVSASVTRTAALTADQADFSVVIGASPDATQQQATQILLDAGISSLSLSGATLGQSIDYGTNRPTAQTQVLFQFTFSVPAAGLKDAAGKMEALRASPPDLVKSLQYTAVLNASPSTVDAMRQTLLPQLFADAQKKAQTLAAASGLKLGGIEGVSESFYSNGNSVSWIGASQFVNSFDAGSGGSGVQCTFFASVNFSVLAQ